MTKKEYVIPLAKPILLNLTKSVMKTSANIENMTYQQGFWDDE